jgi:hypothetical protein
MPQVKLLTSLAGRDVTHGAGDIIECTDGEALRFVAAGIAEAIGQPVERAVKVARPEKAVRK